MAQGKANRIKKNDVIRLKNRLELIFVSVRPSVRPSVPGPTTNTALEAIASSSGKNIFETKMNHIEKEHGGFRRLHSEKAQFLTTCNYSVVEHGKTNRTKKR